MAEEAPKSGEQHAPKSNADLMESAKTVAEAAQLARTQQTDKIDKAKVAGAAEDVLEATKTYGKLDETSGVGKYVDQAEDYLHKYHASDSAAAAATTTTEGGEKAKEEAKEEAPATAAADAEKESGGGGGGGGVGGVMNMAKGLFGK